MIKKKLIILDRDGVINHQSKSYSKSYVKSVKEFRMLPKSAIGISNLCKKGYYVAIATNQSAVGRKILKTKELYKIHDKMLKEIKKFRGKIFHIAICIHTPQRKCNCRKPKSGLIDEILYKRKNVFTEKWLIGDKISDLMSGKNRDFKLGLVRTGLGENTLKEIEDLKLKINFKIFDNLYKVSKDLP